MPKDEIQLSDHFTIGRLIKFVFPSIIMMIFTSIYSVVDGLFVSNYAGSLPFAAINLIMPFTGVFSTIGFMLGTGGTALVSAKLGEKDEKRANEIFSLIVYVIIAAGIFFTLLGEILLEPMARIMGASENMMPYCLVYGRIILITTVPFMLQVLFQSFMVTAEKPQLGLYITVGAGVANMIGDFILVGVLKLGVVGAAIATLLSMTVGGIVPLVYFILPNKSTLRLCKTKFYGRELLKASTNGASELMSNISMSLVGMMYNLQLMKYAGENGVAAYGVIMYTNFIFIALFIGYSMGVAPIIGYNYGAQNHKELNNMFKKSLIFMTGSAILMTFCAEVLAAPLSKMFVGYDAELYKMTVRGFMLYSLSFLIAGFNIFASSFFTALNNGVVSAILSFVRVLFFQILAVIVLPMFLHLDGIWLAILCAELLSLAVSVFFIVKMRQRYHYY